MEDDRLTRPRVSLDDARAGPSRGRARGVGPLPDAEDELPFDIVKDPRGGTQRHILHLSAGRATLEPSTRPGLVRVPQSQG